jgi:hypothetical protein
MLDAGILCWDDKVELIDGEILEMSPIGPRHAATVYCLQTALRAAYFMTIMTIYLAYNSQEYEA